MSISTLDDITKSTTPLLIDFWASWCKPCKDVAPVLDKVTQELSDNVTLIKFNVETDTAITSEFNVMNIPTLVLVVNGTEVWRHTGTISADTLRRTLINKLMVQE